MTTPRSSLCCIAVALLVASCAGFGPPPARIATTTLSPGRLEHLVRVVEDEWVRWGSRVAGQDADGVVCLFFTDGSCRPVDDGCGDEQTARLCPVVDTYWLAVPPHWPRHDCHRTDVCEAAWPAEEMTGHDPTPPWSAAFIGAVMERAGISETEFRRSAAHADYVVAARDGTASAYEAVATPAAARRGDLICSLRGEPDAAPTDLKEIAGGRRAPPMHCDVVVRADPAAGTLEAIGGNVQQTVAKIIVPLDAVGRIGPDAEWGRRWALVLRARREADSVGQGECAPGLAGAHCP